jgi:Protein of unknown function (DUF3040)
MGLPRHERKALRRIEAGLRRSDPALAGLLGEFGESGQSGRLGEQTGAQGPPPAESRPGGLVVVAGIVLRVTGAVASAVAVQGVRERLSPRIRAQPMARAPGQRFT